MEVRLWRSGGGGAFSQFASPFTATQRTRCGVDRPLSRHSTSNRCVPTQLSSLCNPYLATSGVTSCCCCCCCCCYCYIGSALSSYIVDLDLFFVVDLTIVSLFCVFLSFPSADHDDRVVPLHTFKLIAQLQHKLGAKFANVPIMARIDTKSGHGAGKPVDKIIEESADVYSFIINALSLDFKQ